MRSAAFVAMLLAAMAPLCVHAAVSAADTTGPDADADVDADTPLPADANNTVYLSLDDAVRLALRANYDVRNAYLARIAQRYALYVAEDKFRPHISAQVAAGHTWGSSPTTVQTTPGTIVTIAPHAEILLPTGTLFAADLLQAVNKPPLYGTQPLAQALALTATQPLLQNFGVDVNRASVGAAALQESINQLTLKATLMDTVGNVIFAYRQFAQSAKLLDIAKKAVTRARDLLAINHQMVTAGRMARADLIQTESEIATREVLAVNAESNYMTNQLSLLELLALGSDTPIVSVPETVPTEVVPSLEAARSEALSNRPEYFAAMLAKEIAAKNAIIAQNSRRWQLNVTAQHIRGGVTNQFGSFLVEAAPGPSNSTFLGLTLNIPLLDVVLEQQVINTEVSHDQADITLQQVSNSICIQVDTALRALALSRRNFDLAHRARDLADKKLNNEREKLSAGRSSNFQVLSFVDDLVNAEVVEINASISYLNAATTLQIELGQVLDPWSVTIR